MKRIGSLLVFIMMVVAFWLILNMCNAMIDSSLHRVY